MNFIPIQIVRFVDPEFPGWVECTLVDSHGREWSFADKIPVFTEADLGEQSAYPQPGRIACEIIREWEGEDGRRRVLVDTERPWQVFSKEGQTRFEIFADQVCPDFEAHR